MRVKINTADKTPIYKQLIEFFQSAIKSGALAAGDQIPSMNDLSAELAISKETVKKTYGILAEAGYIIPHQGKGFYVADIHDVSKLRVLVLFDKLSVYKEIIFNSLAAALGPDCELTILTHNQDLELFNHYLDTSLDRYDYYVISPHFPLDDKTQMAAKKLIGRIPNRKLIMVDHWMREYPGNYGAVYQDFENDVYDGLMQGLDKLQNASVLKVITLPASLYGSKICKGVRRFCEEFQIPVEFMNTPPDDISAGDTFLILNSQLDWGLAALARKIKAHDLVIGKDVHIISYNEFDLNEVVLDGLTTISADFRKMGTMVGEMIRTKNISKTHCDFIMTRRNSF